MIQIKSRVWALFHPFQAVKIQRKNATIIEDIRLAALDVCSELDQLDNEGFFEGMTMKEQADYLQAELQQSFLAVMKSHELF